jgi:hypothetical protein
MGSMQPRRPLTKIKTRRRRDVHGFLPRFLQEERNHAVYIRVWFTKGLENSKDKTKNKLVERTEESAHMQAQYHTHRKVVTAVIGS